MSSGFHFGEAARIWFMRHRIAEGDVADLERAVDTDRTLAKLARPPSLAAEYRRAARLAAKAPRAAARRRGNFDGSPGGA